MKKLIPLFLAGALMVGMSACGGSSAEPSTAPTGDSGASGGSEYDDIKIAVMLSGPPTDGGYCQQGADGVRAIQEKYGLDDSQVAIIDSVTTADMARSEAENMAAEGYKVIFGQGGEFAEYFSEVAPDYPDTWFVTNGGSVVGENQFPMCMSTEEGGYVCGVIAGMMTKTNALGVIAGGDWPSFTKPGVGFALGAKSVNPDLKIQEAVLSSPDSNECYETTMNQIKSGADFILSNSNEGQAGAMKAVGESENVYTFGCLGNFFDMAPGKVLGNIIGDYNVGYDEATKAIMEGTAEAEIMYLTIANGCVSVEWNSDIPLPEDVQAAVDQAYEDIKSGKIDVPNEYEQDAAKEQLASYN